MPQITSPLDVSHAQLFAAGGPLPAALQTHLSNHADYQDHSVLWVRASSQEPIILQCSKNEKLITVVEANVSAHLVELSTESTMHHMILQEHAQLNVASRALSGTVAHTLELHEAAHSTITVALLGETSHHLKAFIRGRNAVSDVNVLLRASDHQRCASRTENVFLEHSGGGQIFLRALGEHHAHLDVAGKITIGLQGGGTDTYLTQEVLLLDPTAKVNAIPGLEIATNDVRASHSASVSRLTPEDLFYLASRGLDEPEARQLFLIGFLGAVAERAGSANLTRMVMEWIMGEDDR